MRFYIRDLDQLVPALVLAGLFWGVIAFFGRRFHRSARFFPGPSPTPVAAICLTIFFLCLQYSFFDHSLRHLLVVLPVIFWEISVWTGSIVPEALGDPGQPFGFLKHPAAGIALAALIALAAVSLFPCRIPGWNFAAAEAVRLAPRTAQQVEELMKAPDGVLFVDNSAVPWFIDRPVVWAPTRQQTRDRICELLGQPEAKP